MNISLTSLLAKSCVGPVLKVCPSKKQEQLIIKDPNIQYTETISFINKHWYSPTETSW